MRLLIVRHGETVDNLARRIQGQSPGQLTAAGMRQAEALARRLGAEKVDLIISSDLRRAVQTTEIILPVVDCAVEYDQLLRERDFGSLVGTAFGEYEKQLADSGELFLNFRPPGGESLVDLEKRCRNFLQSRAELWSRRTVLISAHVQINRMLLRLLLGTPFDEWADLKQGNCCLNILEGDSPDSMQPVVLNCLKHLQPEAAETPDSAG